MQLSIRGRRDVITMITIGVGLFLGQLLPTILK
jgi:hypothetical protein